MRFSCALLCALLLAPEAALAAAYQVEARTETQLYSFRAWRGGSLERPTLLPRRRLVQYLGFNAYELVTGQPLGFEASLRVLADFGLPQEEAERLDGAKTVEADLLQAAVLYRGDVLGLKVGRQTYTDVMDLVAFDGATVRVSVPVARGLLRLGAEVHGGLWVKGSTPISSSVYQPDGIRESDVRRVTAEQAVPYAELDDVEPLVGGKVFVEGLKGLSASVGFRQAWLGGKTDVQRLGVEARYGRGLGFNVLGGLEYDFVLPRISNARLLARYDGEEVALSAEYLRVSPVLSADSIFLYFAFMPRDGGRVRLDWYPLGPLRFYAQGVVDLYHQNVNEFSGLYGSGALSDPLLPPGFAAGGGAGAAFRSGPLRAGLDATVKSGFGGTQLWVDLTAGLTPLTLPFTVDARVSYANVYDAVGAAPRGSFWGLQLWASYLLTRASRLSAAVEQNFNPYTKSDTKVFLLLDLKATL